MSTAHNRLVADLDTMGFQVEETQSFGNEVTSALAKLKEKDVRIILGNFNESWARRIFCEANRHGMYGRKYQWLIMGTYSEEWWMREDDMPCPLANLTAALEGCILTDLLPLSTNGEITISGITAEEYQMEYDSRRGNEYSRFHGYTYDGVWAVALAIQHVAHRIRHYRKNQTVVDFRYQDPLWEQLFLEALRNTSFEGVTGPVRFYHNERKANILLKQFQNGSEVKVGEFNGVTEQLDLTRGHPIKWHGKYPPKDRTVQIFEHSHVNITIYSLLASASSIGIVMAITFLAINITYRNQRYIKMSSPYLNNLIIIGCMLTYSSVIFLGLDSTLTSVESFPYICTARAWLLMAGFSLAFGSMFSKTWRVHSIFTDVKLNKKVIKDYQLFMVVGVLLVIDLAIMTTWQVTDPFYRETKTMEPYPHPSSEDILIVPENEYCQSERMTVFVGSIYAYKGLLMIFGAFLAWETRHVSIPALNDSKYVGMSVYNVVIMCIMGAAISFVLSDKQDASFIIISVFIIFCTTGTLCLVFVPKLIELKRNPQGSIDKRIRATLRPMSKNRRDSAASELEEKLKEAKATNQKYRKELLERESELQMLVRRLGDEGKDILDSEVNMDRLVVPRHDILMKKEAPSGTETTEISSLCSLNSSQDGEYVNLTVENMALRKKSVGGKAVVSAASCPSETAIGAAAQPAHKQSHELPSALKSIAEQRTAERQQTVTRDDDSEPLILRAKAAEHGQSNAHFVPESAEEDAVRKAGKVSAIPGDVLEDRPRLPTPPLTLCKVVSFGDVTNSAPYTESEAIVPPPRQFYAKPQASVAPSHSRQPSHAPQPATPKQACPAQHHAQPAKQYSAQTAARRRSSVKSTSSGGSAHVNVSVSAPKQRRTSVPATHVAAESAPPPAYGTPRAAGKCYSTDSDRSEREYSKSKMYFKEEPELPTSRHHSHGVLDGTTAHAASRTVTPLVNDSDFVLSANASSPDVPGMLKSIRDHEADRSESTVIQRSVSEKSHERSAVSHRTPHQYVPQEVEPVTKKSPADLRNCNIDGIPPLKQQKSAMSHVHSTPNVATIRGGLYSTISSYKPHGNYTSSKTVSSSSVLNVSGMCSAVSEGELLDLAILPIFQKLLSERHKSKTGYGASIASCPNISIKCDIVEYL
ncbi:gamma-aminobutyric acid type B receptor subunit 2 [Schistocerca nitens]|uniref:gamma-aminobutyric acid type B receptor subunit 2 n=1 Tax=Schistocerca nitens TaxID=7011 RepID=UPI0021191333|nr:gamma-aminobutyric acid type B receptor subunit 2 [Schistocerca nitens]